MKIVILVQLGSKKNLKLILQFSMCFKTCRSVPYFGCPAMRDVNSNQGVQACIRSNSFQQTGCLLTGFDSVLFWQLSAEDNKCSVVVLELCVRHLLFPAETDFSTLNYEAPLIRLVIGAIGNCCTLFISTIPLKRWSTVSPGRLADKLVKPCAVVQGRHSLIHALLLLSAQKSQRPIPNKSLVCCDSALRVSEGHLTLWLR